MDLGLSLLGLQGYTKEHAKIALSFYTGNVAPKVKIMAFLWNSFGPKTYNVEAWYDLCDGASITQVYISNETDRRRFRTDQRNLLYQLDPQGYNRRLTNGHKGTVHQLKLRVERVLDLHNKYGKGSLQLALGLEDNMTHDAAIAAAGYIREVTGPGFKLVRNPVKTAPSNALASCDILEYHEVTNPLLEPKHNYGMVTDGYDICIGSCKKNLTQTITDEKLKGIIYKYRTGEYFMLWHSMFNSLEADAAQQPPPYKRKSNISLQCINAMKKIQEFSQDIR